MTRVQGLFEKGYTLRGPNPSSVRAYPRHRAGTRHRPLWAVAGAGWVAIALLVAGPLTGAAVAAPAPGLQPWTQYDTGRVNVVFPSQLPVVELVQDANASVRATLELIGVYEVSSTGFPHPTVVAAAFPTSATAFNGTRSPEDPNAPTTLAATLNVFPVGQPLWGSSSTLTPVGLPRGSTSLTMTYGATQNTAQVAGVGINWSVSGWPWANQSDLLALRFGFTYAAGDALTACTSSTLLEQTLPPCLGQTVSSTDPVWSAHYSSFEGENGTGAVAVVSWGTNDRVGTSTTPVTAGAVTTGPGTSELLLCAPADAGSAVLGTVAFALVAPAPPSVSALLHAAPLAFVGALAAIVTLGAVGVVAYRRRDRRLRESL